MLGSRWTLKDADRNGLRHLRLLDNFALCLSLEKGRSPSYDLLQLCRRQCTLSLSTSSRFAWRWHPSERNLSDPASRLFERLALARWEREVHGAQRCSPEDRRHPRAAVWDEALAQARLVAHCRVAGLLAGDPSDPPPAPPDRRPRPCSGGLVGRGTGEGAAPLAASRGRAACELRRRLGGIAGFVGFVDSGVVPQQWCHCRYCVGP